MNANFYVWGMVIGVAVLIGMLALVWWIHRTPKRKYDPDAVVLRKDIAGCDGCGALLRKSPAYKQPSTVHSSLRYFSGGQAWLEDGEPLECIREHYLCLRCQVDGTPPAKMAETINKARAEAGFPPVPGPAGEKPC